MVQMNLFARQESRYRHGDQTCGYGGGEERVDELEDYDTHTHTHTHTLPCVKYLASGNLLCNTGNYTWCSVMTQRSGTVGGRSKRESICVYI